MLSMRRVSPCEAMPQRMKVEVEIEIGEEDMR